MLSVGLCLTVPAFSRAEGSHRDFRAQMTLLRGQTEYQNLLANYPRVEALLSQADSLLAARRAFGIYTNSNAKSARDSLRIHREILKIETNFLKLRGDYYYWLALGAGEESAAHKADSCYSACILRYRLEPLPNPADTFVILNQLGQLHYSEGNYPLAVTYLRAVAATRSSFVKPRERQNARMGVAMCQARLGDFDAALLTLDSCQDDKNVWRMRAKTLCLSNEALASDRNIVLPQAGALYRNYVEAIRTEADSVFRLLLSDERERWWVSIRPFITDCWRLEDADAALLYDVALLSKGILLQLCRDMQTDDPASRTRALHLTWQDVQQSLGDRDLAVEWLEYERGGVKRLGAVGLKKTGQPFFMPLCPTDTLLQLQLRNGRTVEQAIASSFARDKEMLYYNADLRRLFHNFFRAGRGARNVYFSPDGVLHLLGIEYLDDDVTFRLHRLTSTRQLIDIAPLADRPALIIGGIDYDAPMAAPAAGLPLDEPAGDSLALRFLAEKTNHITPLAHTLTECETVYNLRHRSDDRLLRRDEASEQSFRLLSADAGIIHLSTHGFFYGELQSGNSDFPLPQQTDAALSQSGLLFAGINSSLAHPAEACATNDGLLSSREISTLHLDSVTLFVVCACQGGLGKVTHDGVFGVQRGLKSAGVQAMVVSLWKVDDGASALFMSNLHRRLREGAGSSVASSAESGSTSESVSSSEPVSLAEAFSLARNDLRHYSPEAPSDTFDPVADFDPEDDELFPYAAPYFSNAFILIER